MEIALPGSIPADPNEIKKRISEGSVFLFHGGSDGNRTHVRRSIHPKRYHHSRYFAFSSVFPCRQGHTLVASSNFFYLLKALKKKCPAKFDAGI